MMQSFPPPAAAGSSRHGSFSGNIRVSSMVRINTDTQTPNIARLKLQNYYLQSSCWFSCSWSSCNWSPAAGPPGCWCRDWCCGYDLEWCSPCIVMLRAVNGTSQNFTVPGEGPYFSLLKASSIKYRFSLGLSTKIIADRKLF